MRAGSFPVCVWQRIFDMSVAMTAPMIEVEDSQGTAFKADVLEGLARRHKTLSSRWLYDDHGSELFEQITDLPEYYPTRTERAILTERADELAAFCGEAAVVLEYGAGASVKSQILLRALQKPRMYVPIDIAGDFLALSAGRLRSRFSQFEVLPVVADFSQDFDLPAGVPAGFRRTGVFLGSTIGNLDVDDAEKFLARVRCHVDQADADQSGCALIGVDLKKSMDILIPAYDDAQGTTAEFNLNLLTRINRELGGTFLVGQFSHEARWNEQESAVEMHLVSLCAQQASVAGRRFEFAEGETIHSESSRKYSVDGFRSMAARAGWSVTKTWTDVDNLFAIVGMEVD
jgi:dimethylhistidine N-methyltransferase